jgi:eukaryotic-like serine/threonine-protein kinase
MGRVFVATDLRLGRLVAVKVLSADVRDPRSRERFEREARALSSFAHPNAVAIFDAAFDADLAYLVMEYVDGPTLASYLARRGPLPVDDVIAIADQVLAALDAAHTHGIVHRDVKPSNILLDSDGVVRLADFGIAKIRDLTSDLTATGQIVGTASYLAPELARGEPATPASDLYAVGIIIFEMLTGEVPMRAETPVATLALRQHAAQTSLRSRRPDAPESLEAAVATALDADPAIRYPSAGDFRAAIRSRHHAATAPTEVEATTSYRSTAAPRQGAGRGGRRRGLIAVLAVLAALAVAAAAIFAIHAANNGAANLQHATSTTGPDANTTSTTQPTTTVSPTTTPRPTSLNELVALLATSDNRYGVQQQALRNRLLELLASNPGQQARLASGLRRDVTRWASTGQLDPVIANETVGLLAGRPQARPPAGKPPKSGGQGDGQGESLGRRSPVKRLRSGQ